MHLTAVGQPEHPQPPTLPDHSHLLRLHSIPEEHEACWTSEGKECAALLPPRQALGGSSCSAKRRLLYGGRPLSPRQRQTAALSAAAMLLLVVTVTSGIVLLERHTDAAPGTWLPRRPGQPGKASRLLLVGRRGAGAGHLHAAAPEQQQQLWNVSLVLHVAGARAEQLADGLREPFLAALMPAAAAAAGGVEVVAASTHWFQPLPAATAPAAPAAAQAPSISTGSGGAVVSASLLMQPAAARRLAAALAQRPGLELRSRDGSWLGVLQARVKLVDSKAAKCVASAKRGSRLHRLLGCPLGGEA